MKDFDSYTGLVFLAKKGDSEKHPRYAERKMILLNKTIVKARWLIKYIQHHTIIAYLNALYRFRLIQTH